MKLIDIARSYLSAPEGDGAGAGAGAPPAAGANGGGGTGGAAAGAAGAGGAKDGEKGGAAGDGAAGKDGQKGGEAAAGAGDQAKAKDGNAAGEFKISIPDGVKVDESRMKSFTDWANKAKLSPEQASSALAYYVEQQKTLDAAWAAQGEKWGAELKADKDFGGAQYDANVAAAQKAILRFGGRELADAITELGLGSHPLLTKAFAKVGLAIKEDTAAVDTAPKGGEPKPGDRKARDAKRYDHPDSQAARTGK